MWCGVAACTAVQQRYRRLHTSPEVSTCMVMSTVNDLRGTPQSWRRTKLHCHTRGLQQAVEGLAEDPDNLCNNVADRACRGCTSELSATTRAALADAEQNVKISIDIMQLLCRLLGPLIRAFSAGQGSQAAALSPDGDYLEPGWVGLR